MQIRCCHPLLNSLILQRVPFFFPKIKAKLVTLSAQSDIFHLHRQPHGMQGKYESAKLQPPRALKALQIFFPRAAVLACSSSDLLPSFQGDISLSSLRFRPKHLLREAFSAHTSQTALVSLPATVGLFTAPNLLFALSPEGFSPLNLQLPH